MGIINSPIQRNDIIQIEATMYDMEDKEFKNYSIQCFVTEVSLGFIWLNVQNYVIGDPSGKHYAEEWVKTNIKISSNRLAFKRISTRTDKLEWVGGRDGYKVNKNYLLLNPPPSDFENPQMAGGASKSYHLKY